MVFTKSVGIYCFSNVSLYIRKPTFLLCVYDLAREFTPRPDPRAIENQNPRYNSQQRADAT